MKLPDGELVYCCFWQVWKSNTNLKNGEFLLIIKMNAENSTVPGTNILQRSEGDLYVVFSIEWAHNFPWLMCKWGSGNRKQHYITKDSPHQENIGSWSKKYWKSDWSKRVLLPPLHVILGLTKQFLKALPREIKCFKYILTISRFFQSKGEKRWVCRTRYLETNERWNIYTKIEIKEMKAGKSFKLFVTSSLGNKRDPNYKPIVEKRLNNLKIKDVILA